MSSSQASPGQSHLGAQPQQVSVLDLLDPPPVQRRRRPTGRRGHAALGAARARRRGGRAGRGPASRDASEYQPCVPPIPSMTATAALAWRRPGSLALVDVQRAAGPVGVARQRVARRAGGRGGGPRVVTSAVVDSLQRQLDGAFETDQPSVGVRNVRRDVVLLADDLVASGTRPAAGRGCWAPASRRRPSGSTTTGYSSGTGRMRRGFSPAPRRSAASSPGRSARPVRRCRSRG